MHEKELISMLLICVLMAQKLVDLSTTGSPRLIDGILLTKFDTIDDKVFGACAHLFLCEFLTHYQGLKVAYS
jgi:signal recognition particle receptor subunit alpha